MADFIKKKLANYYSRQEKHLPLADLLVYRSNLRGSLLYAACESPFLDNGPRSGLTISP